MKILPKVFLFVIMCNMFGSTMCHSMEETSVLDKALITPGMISYYADKRPLRVEVSIGLPSGCGERALDFFIVEDGQLIPVTLRAILEKSPFIQAMITEMFNKADVLMVTESVSGIEGSQKINGFIGINKEKMS